MGGHDLLGRTGDALYRAVLNPDLVSIPCERVDHRRNRPPPPELGTLVSSDRDPKRGISPRRQRKEDIQPGLDNPFYAVISALPAPGRDVIPRGLTAALRASSVMLGQQVGVFLLVPVGISSHFLAAGGHPIGEQHTTVPGRLPATAANSTCGMMSTGTLEALPPWRQPGRAGAPALGTLLCQ